MLDEGIGKVLNGVLEVLACVFHLCQFFFEGGGVFGLGVFTVEELV